MDLPKEMQGGQIVITDEKTSLSFPEKHIS